MAEITKSTYATDVKDVKYNGTADRAFWNRKEVVRMVRNGNIVFNRAFFELICEDELSLTAVGSREQPLHDVLDPVSRKTDCDGTTVEVAFEGAEDVIVPNETEEEKSGTYTIRQKVSNLEITGRWKQEAAKVEKYEFLYVERASVVYDDNIRAGGSTVAPRITVYYMLKEILSSGVNREKLYSNAGYATDAAGAPLNSSGATIDDDGGVHAGSLGRKETNEREVFAVNEMAGTVYISQTGETKPWEWTGSVFVYQNQNKPNYGTPYYSIWSDVTPDSLDAATTSVQVEISAWLLTDIVWSSGAEDQDSEKATVYLEPSVGTLSSTSASGNATIIWSGLRNTTGVDRTVSLRIYHGSAGVYDKTYSLPQSGAEFSKWVYWKIQSVSAGYDRIPAGGGTVIPHVSVTVLYYAEYTDGTAHYDETTEDTYSGVSVSAATAPNAPSVSGVTFNSKTGAVYAPSLEQTESPTRGVFYVGSLSGSFVESISNKNVEWSWSDGASVEQAENYRHDYGDAYMEYKSSVSTEELLAYDTSFVVYTTARQCQDYYWDSDPVDIGTDYTDATLSVMVNRNTGDVRTLTGANKSTTFKVGANTSTDTERTFLVEVYSPGNEYYEQYYVVQAVNRVQWAAPVINGTLTVSNISAKGGSVSVLVPIVQNQYDSGGNVVATHTESVYASAIGGTPSNGGSVSGGVISAPNLGQTATSERTVFTITSVTVKSTKTNTSYTIDVSPSVPVKQNRNYQWWERSRYNVSITPQGTIPVLGGSTTLLVNAYEWVHYYWASAPETPTNETGFSMNGYVTSVQGTITGSPTVGTGKQVTLTYNVENDMLYQKGISVSLTAKSTIGLEDITASTVVYQEPTKYVFVKDGNLDFVEKDGGLATLFYTSTKNGYAYPISKSVFKLSDTTNMAFEGDSTLVGDTVGHYKINVRIQPNSGAARTFSVTANHPVDPNASIVWNIDQMGVGLKKAWFSGTFKFGVSLAGGNNYNIINISNPAMSAVGDAYGGGTLTNLQFKVVNISTGEVYATSTAISSVTVENNGTTSITLRALSNPSGLSTVQVDMWYDGEYQESYMIAANPESQSEE